MKKLFTNHGFLCLFIEFQSTSTLTNKKREIEQIFDRLSKILGIRDELEQVDSSLLL